MATFPALGWIDPALRTNEQNDAHAVAVAAMPKFSIVGGKTTLDKGERIVLTDLFKHPDVVADIGYVFPWFHQVTGSCVGASLGTELVVLGAVQRLIADAPTKAMVPWWPYNYGMTRLDEGDRGQGEGAINSVAAARMKKGVLDSKEVGLPTYSNNGDGLILSSSMEMQWSYGGSQTVSKWETAAAKFPLGTAAVCNNVQDLLTGIINGYPGYDGCSMYVGNGSITGSGDTAYVRGRFDGNGGHSTGFVGAWNHPNDGMLYLYQNNWPKSTYPVDPVTSEQRCQVWIPESEVEKIWTRLGGKGEIFVLSHLNYFPSQPKLLDLFV